MENTSSPHQLCLAVIPARGGSKSIPRKNTRLLSSKPLIAYTIEAALSAKHIDRVAVSTEDQEIAEIARKYGAEVTERPLELAQDDTPSLPVYQHLIKQLVEVENYHPNIIVILQPTSPLRTAEDIEGAIQKLLETRCDSVVSVCEVEHPPHWTYTLDEDRLKLVIHGSNKVTQRQETPKTYRLKGT